MSLDVLGIKPVGESISTITKGGVDGAGAFLSRICLPAAEEYGFYLRDKIRSWRSKNMEKLVINAELLVVDRISKKLNAHPRVVHDILEKGSWSDDETFQKMWAGLLAASCTDSGCDDSNIVFVNILSQLTTVQVRVLNYACENAPKFVSKAGLPYSDELQIDADILIKIAKVDDIHRLDRELDCLRVLELIGRGGFPGSGGGFDLESGIAKLNPSAVALHLYIKAQGFLGTPIEYWQLQVKPTEPNQSLEPTNLPLTDLVPKGKLRTE